ncbi:MAG: hypothetical protein HKN79_02360 [Flavobacteriales bacterium]|nr:hypothetical protein [Flavobacteriales bacterium]
MKRGQWIAAILMAIVLVILGGFRDILFVNINEQIAYNDGLIENYRVLEQFDFLNNYDSPALNQVKWILTILFTVVYLGLSMITFRMILKDMKGSLWILYFYLSAFAIAGVIFIAGWLFNEPELGYTLSRVVMGALQSPFPLMLMIPARMLVVR